MLTSLLSQGSQAAYKSCHVDLGYQDTDSPGSATFISGTNFNINGCNFLNADGSAYRFLMVLENYVSGAPLTVRLLLACTVTTGTKTFTGKIAAVSPADAQSLLTKAYGTSVVSAATAPSGTTRGLYEVLLTFTTAAELNNAEDGDYLAISIAQSAHGSTSGTATLIGLEVYS